VPRVLVSADCFLGDLRVQLAKKLPKTAGVPRDRFSVTVTNWMAESVLAYVGFLEARGNPEFNKDLADFEVDVQDHKWKDVKNGRDVTTAWCFSAMVVAETICDLLKIVDCRGVRFGPRDKEVSCAYKIIFVLNNGDVVAAVPPVHVTYRKSLKGTLTVVEKVDVSFSTVFISNASGTQPQMPIKVLDISFNGANRDVWPLLPGYVNYAPYVTCKLGKTLLEACAFYEAQLKRSDMFRETAMEQAKKWAAISDEEIGVASHPHFMNPRVIAAQTGLVIPDAIRLKREAKEEEKKASRERREAAKKRKSVAAWKARASADKLRRKKKASSSSSPERRMTRYQAAKHAAWCKKMQAWGAMKRKRGF